MNKLLSRSLLSMLLVGITTQAFSITVKPGDKILASWFGQWHPATVLAVNQDKLQVHYIGYADRWNEWISTSRVEILSNDAEPLSHQASKANEPIIRQYYRSGDRVYAKFQGRWLQAKVIAENKKEEEWKIRITHNGQQIDKWLTVANLRPIQLPPATLFPIVHDQPIHLKVGDEIFAEWHAEYYPATVIEVGDNRWKIHYLGYDSYWDNWVDSSRVMPYQTSADHAKPSNSLIKAIQSNDFSALQNHIKQQANINATDKNGVSPLMLSCELNNTEFANYLLKHGANVNQVDEYGQTALLWATSHHNWDLVKTLLQADANPNLGHSQLFYPIQQGQEEIVRIMLAKGADPTREIIPGITPLQLAKNFNRYKITRLLKNAGAKS